MHIAESLSNFDNQTTLDFATKAVEILKPRQYNFDSEDTALKREIAEVLSARDEFDEAAKVLETILVDQSDKSYKEKVDIWLLIAENWFQVGEPMSAEKFVNKAAFLMHHLED